MNTEQNNETAKQFVFEGESLKMITGAELKGDISFPSTVNGKTIVIIPDLMMAIRSKVRPTSIRIPDSVRVIGRNAFKDLLSLRAVCIPDSLERIEDGALSGCKALEAITIPKSVSYIGREFAKVKDNHINKYHDYIMEIRIN